MLFLLWIHGAGTVSRNLRVLQVGQHRTLVLSKSTESNCCDEMGNSTRAPH